MTKPVAFTARVTDGRLPPAYGQQLAALLRASEGRLLTITVTEATKGRTNNQNRFYQGPFVEAIRAHLLECGYRLSADDVHAGLRDAYAKNEFTITLPDGTPFRVPPSTARLRTVEFESYLEEIRAEYAGRFGWQLPFPNEPTINHHQPKETTHD